MESFQSHTLVIGASISGLAMSACLTKAGVEYLLIEKNGQVGSPWRNHYERLHLHTNKRNSNLPFRKFGRKIPRYPSREQVIEYLEDYQREFDIRPIFDTQALSVRKEGDHWVTETIQRPSPQGSTTRGFIRSKYLVMATGAFGRPKPVEFRGMESFPGRICHSYQYKTGKDFTGQRVLVAGFGNSACEIAIDLYEQGSKPFMSVRSPVNVIPRDVLGLPVLELSLLLSRLSPRMADRISAPLVRALVGDITKLGLRRKSYGPLEEIERDGSSPVLDIGALHHVRQGHIGIRGEIEGIEGRYVRFKDGGKEEFDAIVAAIGYYRDYSTILDVDKSRFEDLRFPLDRQRYFGLDGLYFCGYWISPTGQIREIASDARKIAKDIARKEFLK